MNNIQRLKDLLSKGRKKIVITTHHKPDADALGSSLALFHYFKRTGHDPIVISPTDYPGFLNWMPGQKTVINFEAKPDKAMALITDADLIFCCDMSSLERINEMGPLVKNSKAKKVLIDHHLEPEDFAVYMLSDPESAATAELVYDFIVKYMDDKSNLTKEIAELIYAGILTDTGSFKYPTTTKKTHQIVAHLMDFGINHSTIHHYIYDNSTEIKTRFLGFILKEKIMVLKKYKTAYITLTREELKKYKSRTGDTEGFVNYALAIEGTVFAAIIVDRGEIIKLSFRSRGNFPVNEFARDHFEGGGHKNAAGGKCPLSLEETVQKFVGLLPGCKDRLKEG